MQNGQDGAMIEPQTRPRAIARYTLGIVYLIAGIAHVRSPAGFLEITPDWVPWPQAVIFATGLCEVAGAVALLVIPRLRYAAGIAFALYAVCVYPANIKHAMEGIAIGGQHLGWWYHGPRLAFQPVFVWWALWTGGVTDWPFRKAPQKAAG
jgi:uncharacterized membrane protein